MSEVRYPKELRRFLLTATKPGKLDTHDIEALTMDGLALAADERIVEVLGLLGAFINGLCSLSAPIRLPNDGQVLAQQVLAMLMPDLKLVPNEG